MQDCSQIQNQFFRADFHRDFRRTTCDDLIHQRIHLQFPATVTVLADRKWIPRLRPRRGSDIFSLCTFDSSHHPAHHAYSY